MHSVFTPLVEGKSFATPEMAFLALTAQTEVLAIQADGQLGQRDPQP